MVIVVAGLIYREGELLITRRPPGKHGALKWEFPGGKLEEDEKPSRCLIREIREELDVEVEVGKIREVVFHRYPDKTVLLLFYDCKWLSGEPKAKDCIEFAWVRPGKLGSYDFLEADRNFIDKLDRGEQE